MPASSGHETAGQEENMAEMDDQELFSSANADDSIPEVTEQPAEAPATETPQQDDRPRDEHGRFAPKQAETTVDTPPHQAVPQGEPAREDAAHVPSWRLREEREKAEAIERRYNDERMQWQRQLEMLQRQVPKPEPVPAPDLFENPNGFVEHQLRQGMTPYEQQQQALKAEVQAMREENSRWRAEAEHGADAVRDGFQWLEAGTKARDPEMMHIYDQVMQSRHPFDTMVKAFKEISFVQQVRAAGGPDKWREQQLAAGQPQQQSQQRQPSSRQPQGSEIKLPPTLRSIPSARSAADGDDNDMSDAALFRHASR
jgi:hypothetical protein